MPKPRPWLNAYLKSPDVVIFDQNLSVKLLKLCFPCCLSWFSSYFSSRSLPCRHFVQVNLQCHSLYLGIILCYFLLLFSPSCICIPCSSLSSIFFLCFLPHFTALPTECSAVFILYLFFFQPSAFISTLCFRLFPCGSVKVWWVTNVLL